MAGVGSVAVVLTTDNYPISVAWKGILVDDSGFSRDQPHHDDIIRRVREVLEVLWPDRAGEIEQEACEILGVGELRDYFSKPGGFFQDHLKRYSKSRRKAPIYWPIATPSGSYTVWLYYHRFTRDTFYRVLEEYVRPKVQHEERALVSLTQSAGGSPTASQRKEIEDREQFVAELREFADEVARVAALWNPDLNDGVIINYAPLWRLVAHYKPWQKECRACWDKLVAGEYDWAHLAMHLWPERVVPKCATDRSLAIAHGLDEVFWIEDDRGRGQPRDVDAATVQTLIRERTSPAVKAALESLLAAPAPVSNRPTKRAGRTVRNDN